MWLTLAHPLIASRSCSDCKQWMYNEDGTQTERPVGSGQPVRRPLGMATPCWSCPKIPQGREPCPESALELDERMAKVYQHYRGCKAVGRFPEDDLVTDHARVIGEAEDAFAAGRWNKVEFIVKSVQLLLSALGAR